jgi:uncharacterized protein (DUF885 family)
LIDSSASFAGLVDELLADYYRLWPTFATELGMHAYDDRWPDLTDAGHAERVAFLRRAEARLAAVDRATLSRDEAIDHEMLVGEFAAIRFSVEDLREDRWNPMAYVYLFGGGLFALLAREFAPLDARLTNVAARLRGLPAALDEARANLTAPRDPAAGAGAAREVSRLHSERAVGTMTGVADLARTAATQANEVGDQVLRSAVQAAADEAVDAVEAYIDWLRDELVPDALGDFRLGEELYERKFPHALGTRLTPDELEARASSAFAEVRAEMVRLARELWPTWIGDEAMPGAEGALVRRVLDAIAADHPRAEELLDWCRAENGRIEAFIRERGLIGLAEEPLQVVWTPPFLRAFGGAMLIPPGPLDRGLDSFFAITPLPDDWTDARRESWLREQNSRQLRLLTIHEAVPGHYLQLAWSNRCPSLVRAIFSSGTLAEGWAVYVTQVMMDVGYGAEDPALMLVHWKFFLRSITNALMDIGIHAGAMDEDDAMRLMVEGGFQEEGEAANKWDRARLSSTQLCQYFLGSVELTDIERETRQRREAAGLGWEWRPFLESMVSHGSPPPPILRRILLGD